MKNIELSNRSKGLTTVLFVVYLIVLSWVILLKAGFTLEGLQTFRRINFIPLGDSVIVNNRIYTREIYLNAIIFIPFGVYLSMLKANWSFIKRALTIASISLLFETIQYILAIGGADITDLISNSIGGIAGIVFYKIVARVFKNKLRTNKIVNTFALIGTLVVMLFIGVVLVISLI